MQGAKGSIPFTSTTFAGCQHSPSLSATVLNPPTNGFLTLNSDGTFSYSHDGSETTNDPPVAGDDSATVDEGGLVTIDLTGNDTDVDGTVRFATIVSVSRPANGSLVVNGNGNGNGTENGTVTYTHDGSETTSGSFSYMVNDNDGATSNEADVNVTVIPVDDPPPLSSSRDIKEGVVENLSEFSGESRRIKKAIREVQRSLELRLWEDDLHLDTRRGQSVFDRERVAVRELMRLLRENYDDDDRHRRDEVSAEALAASEAAIDALVAADRLLAQTAWDDATAAEVLDPKCQKQVDKELARALKDMDRGDSEQADNDSDDAIKKYKSAWRHAQKAIKEAARKPRKPRDRRRGRGRDYGDSGDEDSNDDD